MNYAIIAAGEGSRLAQEGVSQPKPLVEICGRPMIARLLEIFQRNGAEHVSVIVNEQMVEVQHFLHSWQEAHPELDLRILVQSTPSSMHSLSALCQIMPDGPFVCTTVDTIFQEKEFTDYVNSFTEAILSQQNCRVNGVHKGGAPFQTMTDKGSSLLQAFVVTPFVEDEKPLWVETDDEGMITAFKDQGPAPYVSGGIYGMDRQTILPILDQCLSSGKARMRNFQRALLEAGIPIHAHVFDKVMDIDHVSDILEARKFLSASRVRANSDSEEFASNRGLQGGHPLSNNVALIYRAPEYSPNGNVPKDAAILEAVGAHLEAHGAKVTYLHEEDLDQQLDILQQSSCIISMARRWKSLLLLQQLDQNARASASSTSRLRVSAPSASHLRASAPSTSRLCASAPFTPRVRVLNRPSAVQITVQSRSTTLELLQSAGLPVVPYWSYEPSEDLLFQCEAELQSLLPGWVKAMHPRGVTPGDVQRVETPLEADTRVLELVAQGYTDIIVTQHLEGPLLKLYVVGDHCWPESPYADLALHVGQVLGLSIYGVDLILSSDGPRIIDVNDFPSFSSCLQEASEAIVNY